MNIDSSIDTVKRTLKKLGYSYKRPLKTVPKTVPSKLEKQEHIQNMIKRIKEIVDKGDCEIFALDESHFSLDPYLSRGWIKRGQKKTSFPNKSREKNSVWCIKSKDKTYVLFEEFLTREEYGYGK